VLLRQLGDSTPDMPDEFGSFFRQLLDPQRVDFTVRKQILWESDTASQSEVARVQVEFIQALRSNDQAVGYNRWPRKAVTFG
jgi:hypothetical protein